MLLLCCAATAICACSSENSGSLGGEARGARERWTSPTIIRPTPAHAGRVSMTFAWPDGTVARVHARRRLVRRGLETLDTGASWSMQVDIRAGRVSLVSRELDIDRISARLDEDVANGSLIVLLFVPSMEAHATGAFSRLLDPARTRGALESALAFAAPMRRRTPQYRPIVDRLLEDQSLEISARNGWLTFVEGFAGKAFDVGGRHHGWHGHEPDHHGRYPDPELRDRHRHRLRRGRAQYRSSG